MHGLAQSLSFTDHNSPLQAQDSDSPQNFGVYFQHNDLLTSVSANTLRLVSFFPALSKIKTAESGFLFHSYRKLNKKFSFISGGFSCALPRLTLPFQEVTINPSKRLPNIQEFVGPST